MSKEILLDHSILGGTSHDIEGKWTQGALVAVENEHEPYGMRVFVGASHSLTERGVYQDVADWGDEISFHFIERLYKAMLKNKEEYERRQSKTNDCDVRE